MIRPRLATALVASLIVAACSATPSSSPALQTIDTSGLVCGGVGLADATLHGSASDPRVAWIEMSGYGQRQAVFPRGFSARFSPSLEVLDDSGAVVFREGDKIADACGGPNTSLLIGLP